MTPYETLAETVLNFYANERESRSKCSRFVHGLFSTVANHWGCPQETVRFIGVDQRLEFTGTGNDVRKSIPELTASPDGFWCFGVEITFQKPGHQFFLATYLLLKVKDEGSAFAIVGDKRTQWTTEADSIEFANELFEKIQEEFQRSPGTSPRVIGFSREAAGDRVTGG